MIVLTVFALFAFAVSATSQPLFSFSQPVGSGYGSPYLITGKERITAVRLWDTYYGHVYGLQVRHGLVWSNVAGYQTSDLHQIELFDDEAIIEISGKYAHYVQSIVFTTSLGRTLQAGQPGSQSFNMFPENDQAELVFLSGNHNGGITSIGAHWAVLHPSFRHQRNNNTSN